jgi:G:T-mismatch repair DNA endonuclease (very short patch repair protein)
MDAKSEALARKAIENIGDRRLPGIERERDNSAMAALEASGWKMLVVWECETRNETVLARRLRRFLD